MSDGGRRARILVCIGVLALAATGAVLLHAQASSAAGTSTTLHASVGPGYVISLKGDDGSTVRQLAPGSYTIDVNDQSDIHNFHLSGPGVDMSTDIDGTGTATWNVTLAQGTYTYVCDAHATTMKGTFTVGTAPAAPAPTKVKAKLQLVGTVGPGYTIGLTTGGKKVTKLPHGTYSLVIHDKATIHAFSLDGPHGYAKDFTTVPFVGTKTFTLVLKAGSYKYYCPPHESVMFGRFTVT